MVLFANQALARQIEGALCQDSVACAESVRKLQPDLGVAVLPVAGGEAVYAGPLAPFTRATGMGLEEPVAAADLDRLEAFYHERGVPALIDLCPLADKSLLALVQARGYRLVRLLNHLVRLLPFSGERLVLGSVSVRRARPNDEETWVRTVCYGFREREDLTSLDLMVARAQFKRSGATCFIGELEGQPAAGGAISIRGDVAILFGASTVATARRMGLQTALLNHRLQTATAAGCELAVARAVPGSASQRNLERLGFAVAYTTPTLALDPPA